MQLSDFLNSGINVASLPSIETRDLKKHFSAVTLERARGIVENQLIVSMGWDEDVQEFVALVQGTDQHPYSVFIDPEPEYYVTDCSCPVGMQCKHGAACLLALQAALEEYTGVATSIGSHSSSTPIELWKKQLIAAHARTLTQGGTSVLPEFDCLIYTLSFVGGAKANTTGVELNVLRSKRLQNGQLSKGQKFKLSKYGSYYGGEVVKQDIAVLDTIRVMETNSDSTQYGYGINPPYRLNGVFGDVVMKLAVATGRLFLTDERASALKRGPARNLTVDWVEDRARSIWQVKPTLEGVDEWHAIYCDPPWYLHSASGTVGVIETNIAASALALLLAAPELPVEDAQKLSNEIAVAIPDAMLPLPVAPDIEIVTETLQPAVMAYALDDSLDVANWVLSCVMTYGELRFPVELHKTSTTSDVFIESGISRVVVREHESEFNFYQQFRQLLPAFEPCLARNLDRFTAADHQPVRRDPGGCFNAFEQLLSVVEQLEQIGFDVQINPPVGVDLEPVTSVYTSLDSSTNGWFDVAMMLEHEDHQYELLPMLAHWLEKTGGQGALRFQAQSGQWLEVPESVLKPVLATMQELYDGDLLQHQKSVSKVQALRFASLRDQLDDAGVENHWEGEQCLFELVDNLIAFEGDLTEVIVSAEVPIGLDATLRDYQRLGVGWLNLLEQSGLNGILADDMGLGKTVQALAHIQHLVNSTARRNKKNRNGPFLIIAPTSLLGNWAREARRFTPGIDVRVWHGSDRHDVPLNNEPSSIVVTSYTLALRDVDILVEHGFKMMVLDEAQYIKNPNAKVTQAIKSYPVERRLCLTGTPIENHLGELWSLFDFLLPGMLSSQKQFARTFRTPIEKHGNVEKQGRLNAVVRPFILRRRKEDVATELPSKTEIVRYVSLGSQQAKLYETIRISMQKRVKKLMSERGLSRSHIEMLDALLKLRQTCCHPRLVKLAAAKRVVDSAKTTAVIEMIEELVAEGRKVLLFSQFTEMLGLLESELKSRSIDYVKLTGRTRKRDQVIDAFQRGSTPLFLISLKAGGTGLNLTAADTVIHYDPWWNPAVERQATDRAHRIGQTKPVFVYKMVVKDTVEEKIVAMQQRKQSLADATVEKNNEEVFSRLSTDDVLALFD